MHIFVIFQVVGYDEIMEMLTDYDYTIDYTNDAGGRRETWGNEAGHGIVSARQMLAWVKANCYESCPGGGSAAVAYGVQQPTNRVADGRAHTCRMPSPAVQPASSSRALA